MTTPVRPPHRCSDTSCRCPLHGTALYYAPAGDLHACQDPDCRYAQGISTNALTGSVFARFVAAHQNDPERVLPPAVLLGAALRTTLSENRLAPNVPDAEVQQLLHGLPEDPTPAGYDEGQALGRLALTAETLRMALFVREVEAADDLADPDTELHQLMQALLDAAAAALSPAALDADAARATAAAVRAALDDRATADGDSDLNHLVRRVLDALDDELPKES
ncbi:hypothetical protein [Streptomyces sp. NPDC085466]|uniref:hypothetical protein n=1 Tax=Streptomyces sp. NPDC085466 TaxID=3365725 RepID=UPI0037D4249D